MMETLIRVTERQGLFKGDLNLVQRLALQWLMNDEQDEMVELENLRAKNYALASNPATSSEFLKALFEEPETEDVEWIEVSDLNQVEDLLKKFDL